MNKIKVQNGLLSPVYKQGGWETPKQAKNKNSISKAYDICRTVETEESICPIVSDPSTVFRDPNEDFCRFFPQVPEQSNPQDYIKRPTQFDIDVFLKELQLINFLSQQNRSHTNFIAVKLKVITKLKTEIQEKEILVMRQKGKYERRLAKFKEKKKDIGKIEKQLKQLGLQEEFQWKIRIKKIERELEWRQWGVSPIQLQKKQGKQLKQKRRQKNQISVPILMPYQCYTSRDRYNSPFRGQPYNYYNQFRSSGQPDCQRLKTQKGSKISETRLRTEPTDGFYTKRELQQRPTEEYIEEYSSSEEEAPLTDRKKFSHQRTGKFDKASSTLDLKYKDRSLSSQYQTNLQQYKKKKASISEKIQVNDPQRSKNENKIKDFANFIDNFEKEKEKTRQQDKEDDNFMVLLQKSFQKEKSKRDTKRNSAYGRSIENNKRQLDIPKGSPFTEDGLINSRIDIAFSQSPQRRSLQRESSNQSLDRSPVRLCKMICESAVKIELSDDEMSKISKKDKECHCQSGFKKTNLKGQIAEDCALIEQESEEYMSLKTTSNKQKSPKEASEIERPSTKQDEMQSVRGSNLSKREYEPLSPPPLLEQLHDIHDKGNQGISKIELNMMSRQSRDLLKVKKQNICELQSKESLQEDNLMTISLAKESRISRQKRPGITLNLQKLQEKKDILVNRHIIRSSCREQSIEQFDFGCDLAEQSKITKLKNKNDEIILRSEGPDSREKKMRRSDNGGRNQLLLQCSIVQQQDSILQFEPKYD